MNKKIIPLLLISFTNTIGFSILIPVLPFLAENYNAGPIVYGMLISVYSLFQFVGSPVLGALSDAYGRKPVLLMSHGGTLIGWLLFIAALHLPNISILAIALPLIGIGFARAIDGVTGGNISVANASMSDMVLPQNRAHAFGLLGATFGFGMLAGPVLGGLILSTPLGFSGVGMIASMVSLVTILLIYFWLPESLPRDKRILHVSLNLWTRLNVVGRIKQYAADPQVRILFFIRILFSIGFVAYVSIFIFHAIHYFHLSKLQSAQFMFFTGAFLILNQLFVVKKFVNAFGEAKTFSFGQFFMMASLILMSFAHTVPVFVMFYYILNLGVSLSMISFKSLLIRSVPNTQRGEIMGIEESLVALVQSFIPVLAGILYAFLHIVSFAVFALLNAAVFVVIYHYSQGFSLKLVFKDEK